MSEHFPLAHMGLSAGARVVIAMSGGVDSSVAAAMLAGQGFDAVGITLQLYDHGAAVSRKGACCAGQDIYDAKRVAEKIGIPHYVLDFEARFQSSVIDKFADSYLAGETPVPCISCNQTVKFTDLLGVARDLGAQALVTGHYVRRMVGPDGPQLHRAIDPERDQSYFLFATTRPQLDFLRFPLGDLHKNETRAIAEKFELPVAQKPDSQDICFVPDGRYAGIIEKLRSGSSMPGEIVDIEGHVLARHQGIMHYTIGQRRGLGLGGGDPMFVIKLDAERRQVVVGPREALLSQDVYLRDINWLGDSDHAADGIAIEVKIRSTKQPAPATLHMLGNDRAMATLAIPEEGVAPGQACVFYAPGQGSRVLGGGWITRKPLN